MNRRAFGTILLAVGLAAAGCGGDANVEGNYSVALTNRDNGCNLGNFTPGDTASNISVVITQEGSTATVTVEGIAGLYLGGLLGGGGNVYRGGVDGDGFTVDSIGTLPRTTGNCTYTYNSTIDASLDGDVLTGRIEYRAADNGNSDCSQIMGCLTFQDFNGTRPPQ